MWNHSPLQVLAGLAPPRDEGPEGSLPAIDRVNRIQPQIDRLVVGYLVDALEVTGFSADMAGDSQQLLRRFRAMQLDGPKRHWLSLLVTTAAKRGWTTEDIPALRRHLRDELPEYQIELDLIGRCGDALASIIQSTGTSAILQRLFADDLMDRWYFDSLTFGVFNRLARDAIRLAASGFEGDLRVLEVGGGTAGMTLHLLDEFPAQRTRYVFTDLGAFFLRRAERRLAGHPFVDLRRFDVERPHGEQGMAAASFDLVVANNVIHDTRNVRESLRNLAGLLEPGGLLLMLELTDPQTWWHMCFGSLEGWWRFKSDPSDSRHDTMLLDDGRWRELLREVGFDETAELSSRLGRPWANRLYLARKRR